MRRARRVSFLVNGFFLGSLLFAVVGPVASSAVVFDSPTSATKGRIEVSTPAFNAGGRIPLRFTHYDENIAPMLKWAKLPAGTKSIVVICEDPDAPMDHPFLHWLRWSNDTGKTWVEGWNGTDMKGYFGPQPPPGGDHHYHFQVFALAKPVKVDEPSLSAVVAAMKGHVLAKGRVIGLFAKSE